MIIEACNKGRTSIEIAESNNISSTSVNNMYNEEVNVSRKQLSEVICIDEFQAPVIEGKYAFIMVDPISSNIIDILPSKRQQYLFHYFYNISKEERNVVKYIITDLCDGYKTVIRTLFPLAKHIADRFHWIRLVIQAVQKNKNRSNEIPFKCRNQRNK